MKPGLAVLPMDVWADVFVFPWISRKELAQIVDRFKERAFAEKLQTFLHDPKCGKHSLRYLHIKQSTQYQYQASLGVASRAYPIYYIYKDREFPESEMPKNINAFKRLTIRHFDVEVLDFLNKIKPLFTDVFLDIKCLSFTTEQATNMRILLGHLQPMLASIRGFRCFNECIGFVEQHCSGILALVKEFYLFDDAEPAFIPAYLRWLNTPRDFDGPRFLATYAESATIFAMVEAVRQQFMAATTSSKFVIFLHFYYGEQHIRVEEFNIDNAATNEQLTVRNAIFQGPRDIHYVEIMRHPTGEEAKIREWIEKRAYYEKKRGYANDIEVEVDKGKHIWIDHPSIGHITNKAADEKHQDEDKSDGDDQLDQAGPSTSAKKMKTGPPTSAKMTKKNGCSIF